MASIPANDQQENILQVIAPEKERWERKRENGIIEQSLIIIYSTHLPRNSSKETINTLHEFGVKYFTI